MEARAAINNTTVQERSKGTLYAPQIHKEPGLIHFTAHTIISLILAPFNLQSKD